MKRLAANNLPVRSDDVAVFTYDRTKTEVGIVHFGVGNFHRAHQAVYSDELLCQGETEWAITGISLRSSSVHDALAPQDFLYTQATLGESVKFRVIGAIRNVLIAPREPDAVIDAVASATTKVITTTVTENGYYFLRAGEIDLTDADIQNDLESLQHPRTLYGFLAAGIIRRRQTNGEPLTIICCDNIRDGGNLLQSGVDQLLAAHCDKSRSWARQHVAFASSMVDRITPSTDDRLRETVVNELQVVDQWPVAAEPFSQWVIQDNFAGGRPPFDRVGALFVDDIVPYEELKLQFFNLGHSVAAVLGYLTDCQYIHEALERLPVQTFVHQLLLKNIYPEAVVPDDFDVEKYIEQSLYRYQNRALPYTNKQVCNDSSQKIQQRWMPKIDDALKHQRDTSYLAFSLAAWVAYVEMALKNRSLNDPAFEQFSAIVSNESASTTVSCLTAAGAKAFGFFGNTSFMASVEAYHKRITDLGIEPAISEFLDADSEPSSGSGKKYA